LGVSVGRLGGPTTLEGRCASRSGILEAHFSGPEACGQIGATRAASWRLVAIIQNASQPAFGCICLLLQLMLL